LKFEIRCGNCGKGYLVDDSRVPVAGGMVPCQSCGQTIELRSPVPIEPPPPEAPAAARPNEVCCPRCGLHFVPGSAEAPSTKERPTLLVVEDMDYFVEIARAALAGRYELKTAKTVDEARSILLRGGIDLLLLDLTLDHGEDGLRLLREPPGKVCPVLLFTAQDESEMYGDGWAQLRAEGVDDVVIKGMNMDEALAKKVAAMLGEPQAQDAYRR